MVSGKRITPSTSALWAKTRLVALIGFSAISLLACEQSGGNARDKDVSDAQLSEFHIAGSSTVAPFVTLTAEMFGIATEYRPPVVESTGTGGGFKLFCQGNDRNTPSIAMASRVISADEKALCASRGVDNFIEMKFGYDGIVLIGSIRDEPVSVSRQELYLALAKYIWKDGELVANPYKRWSDINPKLADFPIEVFGPPASSGTRDSFVDLVLSEGAKTLPEMRALAASDPELFEKKALAIRTDGAWVDFGEHDGQIVQSLVRTPHALGVVGFSYLTQSADRIHAAKIDGVIPTFETIVSTDYGLSRPLFLYVKTSHIGEFSSLIPFIREAYSQAAIGREGYLLDKGLIPLQPEERQRILDRFDENKAVISQNHKKFNGEPL